MERNTSGWASDMPIEIHSFRYAAEGAIHKQQAKDYYMQDGVQAILRAADRWAGPIPYNAKGREVQQKSISIIERGLFGLIPARADAFFDACMELLGPDASTLLPHHERVRDRCMCGLAAVWSVLRRAGRDSAPSYVVLLILRSATSPECAALVLRYVA